MKRTICHISPTSIHSTRWIEALHKKGFKVSLITDFQTWVPQKPRNANVHVLPSPHNNVYRLIQNFLRVIGILKKIRPDLVHLHVQHHYALAVYLSHFPYILHSWGLEVLKLHDTSLFRKVLAKQAAFKARKIIVDAECMKKIWESTGIPGTKVEVIPFGVDTNLFKPDINENNVRKKLGIKENDIVVISTRPFFNHYNVECLVKAISIIVKRHENVKLIIKGRGPLESNIRRLAKKLRIDKHTRFTNPVPYHKMPQYLAAASIYVSTSFVDSTSVSLLEAMACGLPPITTEIPGNREWIKDGVNGLLYHPRDCQALAEKITQLIENEELRKLFGERCVQEIERRATWEKCVSKMEAIYQSLI